MPIQAARRPVAHGHGNLIFGVIAPRISGSKTHRKSKTMRHINGLIIFSPAAIVAHHLLVIKDDRLSLEGIMAYPLFIILAVFSIGILSGCHGGGGSVDSSFGGGFLSGGGSAGPPTSGGCADADQDGACDTEECADGNGDGVCDDQEKAAQGCADADQDGACDDTDTDLDGDGIANAIDSWPAAASSLVPVNSHFIRKELVDQDNGSMVSVQLLQKWNLDKPEAPDPSAAKFTSIFVELTDGSESGTKYEFLTKEKIAVDEAGTWTIEGLLTSISKKQEGNEEMEFFTVTATAVVDQENGSLKGITVIDKRQKVVKQGDQFIADGDPVEDTRTISYTPSGNGVVTIDYGTPKCTEETLGSLLLSTACQVSDNIIAPLVVVRDGLGRPQAGELTLGDQKRTLAYSTTLKDTGGLTTFEVRGEVTTALGNTAKDIYGTKGVWIEAEGTKARLMSKILTEILTLLTIKHSSQLLHYPRIF